MWKTKILMHLVNMLALAEDNKNFTAILFYPSVKNDDSLIKMTGATRRRCILEMLM